MIRPANPDGSNDIDIDKTDRSFDFGDSPAVMFPDQQAQSKSNLTGVSGTLSFRTALAAKSFDVDGMIVPLLETSWSITYKANVSGSGSGSTVSDAGGSASPSSGSLGPPDRKTPWKLTGDKATNDAMTSWTP